MKKSITICGDSFNIGIGCRELDKTPYGVLLGKELDKPVINLAKGSSTNLSIFLQAKYAVEKLKDKTDLVLVSNTSYDRIEWFPWDHTPGNNDLKNEHVNYHEYPPYSTMSYHQVIDHPLDSDKDYKGKMFTENIMGIIDYWETFRGKGVESIEYYKRFNDEPTDRMELLYNYSIDIHSSAINKIQSMGMMTMAHTLLSNNNIKHLFLVDEIKEYSKYINQENLVYVSWKDLALAFPDTLQTMHTSEEGHKIAYNSVLEKLKVNKWFI